MRRTTQLKQLVHAPKTVGDARRVGCVVGAVAGIDEVICRGNAHMAADATLMVSGLMPWRAG